MKFNYVGIDVSKSTLEVHYLDKKITEQFDNNETGIRRILKSINYKNIVILEYTGRYHFKLVNNLLSNRKKVCVIPGISIRRYAQMKLMRNKTDRIDAELIAKFGKTQKPRLYDAPEIYNLKMSDLFTYLNTLIKNRRNFENTYGQLIQTIPSNSIVNISHDKIIDDINMAIKDVKLEIKKIGMKNYSCELKRLISIPGIGVITACLLLCKTNGFRNFNHSNQLSCYFGITPRINSSGEKSFSSRISKMGNKSIRCQLYMCSITAIQHNLQCKRLYKRLLGKGKPKKKALLAVANKLTRQCFAIVKNECLYDRNM